MDDDFAFDLSRSSREEWEESERQAASAKPVNPREVLS
jgi:hypothetical protein